MASDPSPTDAELGDDYVTFFDPSTRTRRGLCPVTEIRNKGDPFESHSLYFELHGTGPQKIVFIMGLNSTSFGWAPQVEHFSKLRSGYTTLVFDNRGVGMSGTPKGPYTTSGMAKDVVALFDYVGWTAERDIHVIGISLGGMIALELATLIPERIISLSLVVTTPGGRPWSNLPPWKGFKALSRLLTMSDPNAKIPIIMDMLFPTNWLPLKAEDDPQGRTNYEIQADSYGRRLAITRVQSPAAAVSQMIAGLTHHVTPERLQKISSSIPKVLILTGDQDNLVDARNSAIIKNDMPEAEYIVWEHTGHGITAQHQERFNKLLEKVFSEGVAALRQ